MKFSIKDFFSKCDQIIEEILNGKLHFLGSVMYQIDLVDTKPIVNVRVNVS